jgi:hypothetical protein
MTCEIIALAPAQVNLHQRGHRGRRGLLGDRAQADRVNPGQR